MLRIFKKSFTTISYNQILFKRFTSDVGPKLIIQNVKEKVNVLEIDKKPIDLENKDALSNVEKSEVDETTMLNKLSNEAKSNNVVTFDKSDTKDIISTTETKKDPKLDANKMYDYEHGKTGSVKTTVIKKIPILNKNTQSPENKLENAEKSLSDKKDKDKNNKFNKIIADAEDMLLHQKRSFIKKQMCEPTIEFKDQIDDSILANSMNTKQSKSTEYLPKEIVKNNEKFEAKDIPTNLNNEQSLINRNDKNLTDTLTKYVHSLEMQEKEILDKEMEPTKIPAFDRFLQLMKPNSKDNSSETLFDNKLYDYIPEPPVPELNKNTYFLVHKNDITKIVNGQVIPDNTNESEILNNNVKTNNYDKIIKQHLSADHLEVDNKIATNNIEKKLNPIAPPPQPPSPLPNIPLNPAKINPEKIAPPPNTNIPYPGRNIPHEIPYSPPPKKLDSLTTISNENKMQILETRREQARLLEDVPGPPSLKFIAKLWNFIPQFGSQLSSSLFNTLLDYENYFQWNHTVKPSNYLFNTYGSIIHLPGPFGGNVIMLSRPDHIEMLFNDENSSEVHSSLETLENYRISYKKKFCNDKNTTIDWLKLREKINFPHIFNTNKLHYKIETTSDEFVTKISRARNYRNEVPETFLNEIKKLFIEIFGNVILKKRFNFLNPFIHSPVNDGIRLYDSFNVITKLLQKYERGIQLWRFIKTPQWNKLMNNFEIIEQILIHYIKITEVNLLNKNKLLENIDFKVDSDINAEMAMIENFLVNDKLSHNEISTILLDMFIIGVNSSTSALSFILYNLANNPREQRKLANELLKFLPNRDSYITPEMINDMVYLKACITESLRLDPPFPYISRKLENDVLINSYRIPKGTNVIIANKIICHNEINFKNNEKFQPERWIGNSNNNLIHPLSSIPYGYGKRSCLAKNLSEKQLSLIVAKIIRSFIVEYHYGDIKSFNTGFITMPRKSLKFKFIDRY